jgi:ADP-ribose pyrophosphatase
MLITKTDNTHRGGMDLTISLTRDQCEALDHQALELVEALDTALVALAALRAGADPTPAGTRPSMKDRPVSTGRLWHEWVLSDLTTLDTRLSGLRDATIRAHASGEGSYGSLAASTGVTRATAQSRRTSLERSDPSPAELWATGTHGAPDHPGMRVPDGLRSWSMPWSAYTPVDITPPELRPKGLPASVKEGWAEPYVTPHDVPDWSERTADALVPFNFDDQWRPLNPTGRTGRTGRNLGRWGENQAADPIVISGTGSNRRVLLILRKDVKRWAFPGGMVDPGETAPATLTRELKEETGVDLSKITPVILGRSYVADWRNTDHAWVASTFALFPLAETIEATAGDDAADARWWPAANIDQLTEALAPHGGLYEPHRPMLSEALDYLDH